MSQECTARKRAEGHAHEQTDTRPQCAPADDSPEWLQLRVEVGKFVDLLEAQHVGRPGSDLGD